MAMIEITKKDYDDIEAKMQKCIVIFLSNFDHSHSSASSCNFYSTIVPKSSPFAILTIFSGSFIENTRIFV